MLIAVVLPEQGLRDVGESIVLMGKNTMMKRSIRLYAERTGNETWNNLLDSLVGNVGLIFTKADLAEVRLVCSLFGPSPFIGVYIPCTIDLKKCTSDQEGLLLEC